MVQKSSKRTPSGIDMEVWRLKYLYGKSREEIAQATGKAITTVDYHLGEAKRLVGTDITQARTDFQHLTIPIAYDALALIAKVMKSGNPKFIDAAIKFLRNIGFTVEQSEMTITLKDSTPADTAFDSIFQQYKNRAQQADIIDPGSDTSSNSQATSTSTQSSDIPILPLDKSHIENPKLSPDESASKSDDPATLETAVKEKRDEDY